MINPLIVFDHCKLDQSKSDIYKYCDYYTGSHHDLFLLVINAPTPTASINSPRNTAANTDHVLPVAASCLAASASIRKKNPSTRQAIAAIA